MCRVEGREGTVGDLFIQVIDKIVSLLQCDCFYLCGCKKFVI
ncbi:hypothetical protein BACPLE_03771 [Phocaeicola plebeius DSM 17135]|uniref:Uncharacterized protein n=1 Tax=Phocaeicola plebeius (strain DSM 17135 / JCM 12973 / CCUG 54634 / M2) TaxID=484018 RepID=B5D417_PHOPM|nr:hypothetical protein BACPLE_03771 [Phocaeicola plebeius DSM 17135]